ncbi:MAG: TolC family protein [Candidatus Omnitrophota bacterium]
MKVLRSCFIFILFLVIFTPGVWADQVLLWDDCLAEAKKNNPDLISSVESVKESAADKGITASALYPQVDGNLGVSTTHTNSRNSSTGVKTRSTTDSYTYGATATQLLFDGFKTVNNVKSATEDIKAAQQNYRFTSSNVRLALRTAFINLLRSQELIKVVEEIVRIRRQNLELITLRYQSGLEHRGALLTAEADIAEANFELSQAKRDLVLSQRQLTAAMGRDKFEPISVKGDFTIRDTVKEKPDLDLIVKNNPSLLKAIAEKNSASYSIKSAYANFSPELSGSAGANKTDTSWPPRAKTWNAGLTLTMPIFEGGLRFAQVAKAIAAYKQAEADERSIKDSAVVTLESAWAALQDAIETVTVQYKNLDATVERSKIAEAQYSTGFIDFDNWTIIEDNLVSAKKTYLNAQANLLLAEANWIQAKGETLEYAQN